MVYVEVKTAGLLSSTPPLAVHGNDEHVAKANGVRSTSFVSIGVVMPLRLVNNSSEKTTAKPLGVPFSIVIVSIGDVGE
jgi:hypothetical protein